MAALTTDSNILALACGNSAFLYRFDNKGVSCLRKLASNTKSDSCIGGVCSAISDCGGYYVVCYSKSMHLIKTSDWTVANWWTLAKSISRVRFVPNNHNEIIVADKSGDVYLYSTAKTDTSGELLLGHLSVLLDVLVTPDLKYIITSDRDEKIRVSRYPNSYNIHGYCLGHEEFVTSINLLPHDKNILASCSGDCTIRFWDYINCVELAKYDCSTDVKDLAPIDNSQPPAVIECCLSMSSSSSSHFFTLFSNISAVVIYSLNSVGTSLSCTLKQVIKTSSSPWHVACTDNRFWLLLTDKNKYLACYDWNDHEGLFESSTASEGVIAEWTSFNIPENLQDIFPSEHQINMLYKRKFDNVQEYFEKKKARLETKSEEPQKL